MDHTRILRGIAVLVFFLRLPAMGEEIAEPETAVGRSVSSSGQCIVYGADPRVRGAFCVFAEDVREGLRNVLKLEERWGFPVVIQIRTEAPLGKPSRHVHGQIMPTEEGYRFQLDVLLDEGFTREAMTEELLRLLLLELMLRPEPDLEGRDAEKRLLPHWLHYGVLELVRYEQEGTPNDLFASLLKLNKVLQIEEILAGDPTAMDSISRAVFHASSAAFVRTLLGMESGAQRLAVAIQAFPVYRGSPRDLLFQYFPSLAESGASLEKWWALEMATLGQRKALDFLDAEETQERLREALTVTFRMPVKNEKGKAEDTGAAQPQGDLVVCRLSDFERFSALKRDERAEALAANGMALMRLSLESFPLYRGIVAEYREVLGRVVAGKKRGLAKEFEELEDRTGRLGERLRDMEDFLNWYEGTQVSEKSGAFAEYKRAVEQLRRESPRREDSISRFLDGLEAERAK